MVDYVTMHNSIFSTNSENFLSLCQVLFDDQTFAHVEEHDKYLREQNKPNNESIRPTAEFWLSFIDMMDILFSLRRSIKTGDWKLHLNATRKMLPWFFAYDRPNYSRYLSLYWSLYWRYFHLAHSYSRYILIKNLNLTQMKVESREALLI